jgi:hypothetical protein
MCASHSDSLVGYFNWSRLLIIANAPMSLVDLWQMTTLSFQVLFVIIDCHFVAMGFICIRFLTYFCSLFVFVFSLGYVYLCFHLPSIFYAWVPILDFYINGFPSFSSSSSPMI